tara:strand:+ start:577 stop:972 length:396 start_codon:yes stop_codon:yes gene_type:complete
MAHAHESNLKRIWIVFGILSVITIVEVYLGIIKPDILNFPLKAFEPTFFGSIANALLSPIIFTSPLNFLFIVLTLIKAYYIAWAFMHLEGEKKWFRRAAVWTATFLICYLVSLLLIEGDYLNSTLGPLVKW